MKNNRAGGILACNTDKDTDCHKGTGSDGTGKKDKCSVQHKESGRNRQAIWNKCTGKDGRTGSDKDTG